MNSHPVPKSQCPRCGKVSDFATSVKEEAIPYPGAVSICIECAEISF